MRIALCAKLDLFGIMALNLLLPRLAGHQVSLFFSNNTRKDEGTVPELQQMRFLERDLPLGVVFPLLDQRPGGPDGFLTLRQLTSRHGCEATVITDLKRAGGGGMVAATRPDLILSIRFSLIFPQWLIEQPTHGVINVHPGRLPAYGGLFAPFRQMLHGETELGCTVHYVDRGIDTGPILAIETVPLDPAHSMMWHAGRLYTAGALRAAAIVRQIAAGAPPAAQPQVAEERGYYHFPTAEEFAAFTRLGFQTATPDDYLDCLRQFMPSIDTASLALILPRASAPLPPAFLHRPAFVADRVALPA